MLETFNCGIGMILIVNNKKQKKTIEFLKKKKIKFKVLGNVQSKKKSEPNVSIKNFGEWHIK
jgi:phosphoribosylaminoimidazole (AIR) synthetase